ncbi:MAG: toll/interleukin-1 receptor domain-containing protein [Syntrophobacteraceae bacterium]
MKAFISYSTTDKQIAGRVKTVLSEHRINAFLAHEDISVSQEWKNRIVQELSQSAIFVPLLSAAFKQSDWASQEIGLAFASSDMLFIPLSVDGTNPFGFIAHIQSKRLPADGLYANLLIEPITSRFPHEIIPVLIERMASARSFRGAEASMSVLLPHFDKFTDGEINSFASASIKNAQIWSAADCCMKYLPVFLDKHWSRIDPQKREALEYQIKEQQWHKRPATLSDVSEKEWQPDFADLPPSIQDPGIKETARQLFIKTFGHAPSKRELYDMLNETIIERGTETVSEEDWALFMAEQDSR